MVENICTTVSNYATEALQDTLNFYGKEGFSLVSTQMALNKYASEVMYLFFTRNTEEVDPCAGYDKCKQYKPNYMTNADRIRAMSDEELCKFLGECKFCDVCEEGCDSCTYNGACDKRLLDWLQQTAE